VQCVWLQGATGLCVAAKAAALTAHEVDWRITCLSTADLNTERVPRIKAIVAAALVATALTHTTSADAQSSLVGPDSTPRLRRFVRDLAYGTAEGVGFSAVDQLRDEPAEWHRGWRGYGQRLTSNLGEFYIQEIVTEGLAAAMDRPLDYTACRCRRTTDRAVWALRRTFSDQMRDGTHALAVPRIVGAYVGSFAQASWRPSNDARATVVLVNGTTSLAIGAVVNLYHEFSPWASHNRCRAGGAACRATR
jgi:hypothetical protein